MVRSIIAAQQTGTIPRWPLQAHAGIVLCRAELSCKLRQHAAHANAPCPIYDGPVPDLPGTVAHVRLMRVLPKENADWQMIVALEGHSSAHIQIMLRYETELRMQRTDAAGSATFPDVPASWLYTEAAPDLLILFVTDVPPMP